MTDQVLKEVLRIGLVVWYLLTGLGATWMALDYSDGSPVWFYIAYGLGWPLALPLVGLCKVLHDIWDRS